VIDLGGGPAVARRDDGLATASLVTGITSLVFCGPVTGIPAVIMGLVSRNRISRSAGALGGRGLAIAGVLLGVVGSTFWTIGIAAALVLYSLNSNHPATASAIPCDQLEHTMFHYHVALQIIDEGNPVAIPTDVGRPAFCYYWLHMHAATPGLIHIESPTQRTFTLGDFFDVWEKTSSQHVQLDSGHVGTITLSAGQTVVAFVDGQRYDGDVRGIPLIAHEVIQLEITPPLVDPPPAFNFPSGY
jgi:hypothetical protein